MIQHGMMHYHVVPLRVLKIWLYLLFISIFLLTCNMLLYQEFITLNSCRMSTSLKLGGYCSFIKARPGHEIPKNELLDIFYVGLTDESRSYLDSCVGCVFRERTPEDAEELMGKIAKNHEDWSVLEPPPPPKKRGMLVLSLEDMQEEKKSNKEKGIKTKDVKNLPPIEKLCEPDGFSPLVGYPKWKV